MSARYSIIPARAIDDRRLSRPTLHTLCALGTYADPDGLCWPSQSTLAERLGVSRQAIGKHIAELVSLDYLEKQRQFDKNGAELPCRYRIRFDTENPPRPRVRLAEAIDTELATRGGATSEVAGGATPLGCTNDPINDPTNNLTTTTQQEVQTEPNVIQDTEESSSSELIFDFNLEKASETEREQITKTLKGLTQETAQQVLDEFNEAIGNGVIKKSTWGWLISVAKYAREGRFIPTSKLSEHRRAQVAQTQARAATLPLEERKPSRLWQQCREELLKSQITPAEFTTHIAPLRGREDGQTLWLEAPNSFVAEWVRDHMPVIERTLRAHTPLPVRVCIG